MGICQVDNFYDSIRKYKTKDEVIARAEREVTYLDEQCGSKASLKRYFSKYRNFLKDKIDKNILVDGVPLIDLLLGVLKLSKEEQQAYMNAQDTEKWQGQGALRKIHDIEKYLKVAIGLLSAVSYYDRVLGLAALTGRRVGEIACTARFERVVGNSKRGVFSGQLKTKGRADVIPYEIPLLYDYDAIVQALKSVQEQKLQFSCNPELFNATASNKLSIAVKKYFTDLFDGEPKTKDLRAIYATIAFEQFRQREKVTTGFVSQTNNVYFSKILGHSPKDAVTCGAYMDFCVKEF